MALERNLIYPSHREAQDLATSKFQLTDGDYTRNRLPKRRDKRTVDLGGIKLQTGKACESPLGIVRCKATAYREES